MMREPEEIMEDLEEHEQYIGELFDRAEEQASDIREMKRELAALSEEAISSEEEAA